MATIYDLKRRAKELSAVTETNAVDPAKVGNLIDDTLELIDEYDKNAVSLGVRKTYATVAAMEADKAAPIGDDGKKLRFGQLVSVYDTGNATAVDNGGVYAFRKPGWKLVSNTGGSIAQELGTSQTATVSQKVVTDEISKVVFDAKTAKSALTVSNPFPDAKELTYAAGNTSSNIYGNLSLVAEMDSIVPVLYICGSSTNEVCKLVVFNRSNVSTRDEFTVLLPNKGWNTIYLDMPIRLNKGEAICFNVSTPMSYRFSNTGKTYFIFNGGIYREIDGYVGITYGLVRNDFNVMQKTTKELIDNYLFSEANLYPAVELLTPSGGSPLVDEFVTMNMLESMFDGFISTVSIYGANQLVRFAVAHCNILTGAYEIKSSVEVFATSEFQNIKLDEPLEIKKGDFFGVIGKSSENRKFQYKTNTGGVKLYRLTGSKTGVNENLSGLLSCTVAYNHTQLKVEQLSEKVYSIENKTNRMDNFLVEQIGIKEDVRFSFSTANTTYSSNKLRFVGDTELIEISAYLAAGKATEVGFIKYDGEKFVVVGDTIVFDAPNVSGWVTKKISMSVERNCYLAFVGKTLTTNNFPFLFGYNKDCLAFSFNSDSGIISVSNTMLLGLSCKGLVSNKDSRWIVDIGGSGDLSSIKSALNLYKLGVYSINSPFVIYLKNGEYKEDITLSNFIHLIGENRDKTIIRTDNGDYATPPIEARATNVIRNLTCLATHDDNPDYVGTSGSYAIHVDYSSGIEGTEFLAENCLFIGHCNNAYGSGLWHGQTQILRNCEFRALNESGSGNFAVAVHNGTVGTMAQRFVMENCFLYAKGDNVFNTIEAYKEKIVSILLRNNVLWSERKQNADGVVSFTPPTTGVSGAIKLEVASWGNNVSILNFSPKRI